MTTEGNWQKALESSRTALTRRGAKGATKVADSQNFAESFAFVIAIAENERRAAFLNRNSQ